MIGKTLAHYEITQLLGKGGMGEVYRAEDAKLGRAVALKLLPKEMSEDPERIARFEREARTLASFQHPNIASIFGFEQAEGLRFLVMELVEGEDLSERLERGAIDLPAVLEIARQMALALEAAHARGIVHRDLKPANVKLMPTGEVKVLDFGLARAYMGDEVENPNPYNSPTITAAMTQAGVVMGTAAYMSPEQARGSAVDARADVWAFGCVILECITGQKTFSGATVSDVLAAVLRDELDWSVLPADAPPSLLRLLRRCLERDPHRRLHSMADARLELADASAELQEGASFEPGAASAAAASSPRVWLPWALTALLAIAAVAAWMRPPAPSEPGDVLRFALTIEDLDASSARVPAVSPDGQRLVYYAAGQLWLRELDDLTPRPLAGTEGANCPFWAPDGLEVGYETGGRLWRVPIDGGSPVVISESKDWSGGGAGAVWNEEDRILFATGSSGIYEVPASGGTPVAVLEPLPDLDDDFHAPSLLPDGQGIVFRPHQLSTSNKTVDLFRNGQRSVAWDPPDDMVVSRPVYSAGYLLFQSSEPSSSLWAIRFSPEKGRASGEPFRVESGVRRHNASANGTLVYARGLDRNFRLVRVGLDGQIQSMSDEEATHIDDPVLSPDGTRLAMTVTSGNHDEIVVRDLTRGTRTVLVSGDAFNNPFWLSDSVLGVSYADSTQLLAYDLGLVSAPRVLFRAAKHGTIQRTPSSPRLSSDGQYLFFVIQGRATDADIWYLPLDDSGQGRPFAATAAQERDARPSPVSDLIAYSSDSSGRMEVYLSVFDPESPSPARRWQVSGDGGELPRWSADGSRIYYRSESKLMEVVVGWSGAPTLSRPTELFDFDDQRIEIYHGYCVDPSGPGFCMIQVGDPADKTEELVVVKNWAEAIRGR